MKNNLLETSEMTRKIEIFEWNFFKISSIWKFISFQITLLHTVKTWLYSINRHNHEAAKWNKIIQFEET